MPQQDYESHQDDHEVGVGTDDDRPAPEAAPDGDQTPEDGAAASGAEQSGAAEALHQPPADDEVARIEAEREQRLDADNRPEGTEVDNTERTFDSEKGMFTDSEGYDEEPDRFPPASEQGV